MEETFYNTCKKCEIISCYNASEAFWDDKGYGYSTKLVKCKHCNTLNIVKHSEDYGNDVNQDLRFYTYN